MSIEKARAHIKKWNMDKQILEFETSSATVALAAQALGCDPARIAKTLSFTLDSDTVILIVTAGDTRVDNHKLKSLFGKKVRMLSPGDVLAKTGHEIGGVCPFGINEQVTVYTDTSLQRFHTVFPACGNDSSAIELTYEQLFQFSGSQGWIDVTNLS